MLRRSFVCMTTIAAIGIGAGAQETCRGSGSNANAHLESCCGRKHAETGEGKAGKLFYKAAAGIFRGRVKQLNEKEIVIENDAKQMVSIRRSPRRSFSRTISKLKPP